MMKVERVLKKVFSSVGVDIKRSVTEYPLLEFMRHMNLETVIDVGANVGQFSKEVRRVLPNVTIHAFEPVRECYEKLQKEFAGDINFHAYNFALGSREDTGSINKNEYLPSSSLLKNTRTNDVMFPHTKNTLEESVSIKKLDTVLPPLTKEVLLKLDVQGYEVEALRGAEETLQHSSVVLIETSFVELYEKQPLFHDVYGFLVERGFVYHGSAQTKKSSDTRMPLFEDAIFVRRT